MNCVRCPTDCFAPTMSWLRLARNFFSSPGMVGEVAVLGVDLVGPPEADAAARPGQLPVGDEARQRPADLEHAGDPGLVVVGRELLLLEVRREHDLGQRRDRCPGSAPRPSPSSSAARTTDSTTTRRRSGHARPSSPRAPQRREPSPRMRSESALPSRAERTMANVVFSPFGPSSSGTRLPGDLVRGVGERVQPRGGPGEDARGAALPDGLLHHERRDCRRRGRSCRGRPCRRSPPPSPRRPRPRARRSRRRAASCRRSRSRRRRTRRSCVSTAPAPAALEQPGLGALAGPVDGDSATWSIQRTSGGPPPSRAPRPRGRRRRTLRTPRACATAS